MAAMKSLVLLPLALLSASCFHPLPGPPPRPPFRPLPPYGATGDYREPGTETGTFEPIPDGNRPPPPPDANPRPMIDPEPTLPPEPQPIPRTEYPVAKPAAQPT